MKKYIIAITSTLLLSLSSLAATINLAWDSNPVGEGVDMYNVYELVGTNYNFIVSTPANITAATINNVSVGRHVYVVTAKNYWMESPYSDPVSTPASGPSKPTNLRIIVLVP